MARTILVEASPWNATTGAAVSVALAGGGVKAYRHRSRNDWLAGVVSEPRFTSKIDFDQNGFSGGARPQFGNLEFAAAKQSTVNTLAAYLWIGATIEVFTGDDALASPVWTTLIKGTVASATIAGNIISLGIRDASGDLDDPLISGRFTGLGGIEGDAAAAERIKRRTWGRASNIEAKMLLAANNIYEIGDPAFPLNSIDDVKDKGRSASSLVTVAWAGSIAATLTALMASNAPQGGGSIAPSIACVKWWTQAAGPLTADIKGENGASYVETVASMAERIALVGSALTISNVAAINVLRPDAAGIHIDNAGETAAQALDRLLKGVSIVWNITAAGVIDLSEIKLTGSVETVTVVEASREISFKPVRTRRVGYKRNHRIHGDGEISAANLNKNWLQPGSPLWDETIAGDRWIDTSDNRREYQRTEGVIANGGMIPIIGGNQIRITWNLISDRRIDYALSDAFAAQQAANNAASAAFTAQNDALLALAELDNIASDGMLTPDEKPRVILDRDVIVAEQSGIAAQATSFGITTEKTAYDSAVAALVSYLATLTAPTLWSDFSGNTAINGVSFRAAFANVYAARQTLLNKIADVAKTRAELGIANAAAAQAAANAASTAASTAQTAADTANGKLADIASDSILTPGEKPQVILERDILIAEQSGIDTQAAAFVITTERTAYNNAVSALTTYLATLTTPVLWNDLSANTAIVGTTFRSKFADVYAARQTLLNKVASVAKARADLGVSDAAAAQATANSAQSTANTASTNATDALGKIGNIVSDGILDRSEKPDNVLKYSEVVNEQSGIGAQANTFGITTEKTTYDAAVLALVNYMTALNPSYTDYASDTTIVRATFIAKYTDVYSARQALLNKIAAVAKERADLGVANAAAAQTTANAASTAASTAQSGADTANSKIADIASDSLLTPDEKPRIIQDRDDITAAQAGINAEATNYGITTEKTTYDNAVAALTSYLATLTTPVLWNNLTGNTTIIGATFRAKFLDVYAARQVVLNKVARIAGERALWANVGLTANAPDSNSTVAENLVRNANLTIDTLNWSTQGTPAPVRQVGVSTDLSPAFWRFSVGGQYALANNYADLALNGAKKFFVSGWSRKSSSANLFMNIEWRDTTGGFLSQTNTNITPVAVNVAEKFSVALVPPAGGTAYRLYYYCDAVAGTADAGGLRAASTENGADITVIATMSADRVVPATSAGVVSADNIAALLWSPNVLKAGLTIKIADNVSYALADVYGGTFAVTNTVGSTSKGNITASALAATVAGGNLVVTVDGLVLPKLPFKSTKDVAAAVAAPAGTDSKSWDSGEFNSLSLASFVAISTVKTLALVSGQTLYGTAPVGYSLSGNTIGGRSLTAKWQYSVAGANVWNDFAVGIVGTTANSAYFQSGEFFEAIDGYVDVTQSKGGLGAGNYDVRMVGLLNIGGRTVVISATGLMEAKT